MKKNRVHVITIPPEDPEKSTWHVVDVPTTEEIVDIQWPMYDCVWMTTEDERFFSTDQGETWKKLNTLAWWIFMLRYKTNILINRVKKWASQK